MKAAHFIDGKEMTSKKTSLSESPFRSIKYSIEIPSLEEQHAKILLQCLKKKNNLSFSERKAILKTLEDYNPDEKVLEAVCKMTGSPISMVRQRIEEGKWLAAKFANSNLKEGKRKTVFSAVAPNDPRGVFYFICHLLVSGNPSILKISRREPILATDILKYLSFKGLPAGLLNIIQGTPTNKKEQDIFSKIIKSVDKVIVMGDSSIRINQLSLCAEHARGLVLDAKVAIPYIKKSVIAPTSCFAEHNYIIVGKENYEIIKKELINLYSQLRAGDIMDPKTTKMLIEEEPIMQTAELVSMGRADDTLKIIYPLNSENKKIDDKIMDSGIIVEHYSEDSQVGINPMMDTMLPLYITGIRYAPTLKDALRDLRLAQKSIATKSPAEKSMALGIYGDEKTINKKDFEDIAFDIFINQSPVDADGIRHQGVYLNEVLIK